MKKGLHVTLMTVAIAVMALQAMAMAPVISTIPDPVVGNETAITGGAPLVTNPTPFYYPDAIDLNTKVTDGDTPVASLLWSYSYSGTAIYRINNVAPLTIGTDSILAPGAKTINGATDDPNAVDSLTRTITIRNVKYAPIGGPNTTPAFQGLGDSQVVTLYASDGTSYDLATAMFWTDNGGIDRLGTAPPPPVSTIVFDPPFATANGGFLSFVDGGAITNSNPGGAGAAICIDSALAGTGAGGTNQGGWYGPMTTVLTANTVYVIRARINGTQSGPGTVPFFDLVINNFNGVQGLNLFGGDMFVLDNEGGANACFNKPSTNGTIITWVWAPAAMLSSAWNDTASATPGPFATSVTAANRSFFMMFRVIDQDTPGTTGNLDSGRLCLNKLEVRAVPYSAFAFANDYQATSLTSSNMTYVSLAASGGSAPTWAGGVCTLSAGAATDYAMLRPGDDVYNLTTPSSIPDNFPTIWESNMVYQAVFEMDTPTATDASNPFDVYWVGVDDVTNELIAVSFITGNQFASGMPKFGAPQQFVAFMSGNTVTASTSTNFNRVRPRLDVGNIPALSFTPNTGKVNVHSIKLNKAPLPAIPALP